MKKTFKLTHTKTKYARLVDTVRRDIKKYLKRERNKTLAEGFDTWLFNCRFGATSADAKRIDVADIAKAIDHAEKQQLETFYIEILAKAGNRKKKSSS